MKLKRAEIIIIAVTLAFLCFTAGYFTGRNTAVNVITVEPGQDHSIPDEQPEPAENSGKAAGTESPADAVNESAPVEIPAIINETPSPAEGSQVTANASDKIDINTADATELIVLPGIGTVLAQRIIDYRTEHGRFQTIEEIKDVSGIGDAKFNAIKDMITVG